MNRRDLLTLALTLLGSRARADVTPSAASLQSGGDPESIRALARDAYRFLLPLMEVCRTRDNTLAEAPADTFRHRRDLQRPADRRVTTPNTDTLYSTAFLDLRDGPVRVSFPATGRRYFSLALMDAWSNNFHVAGLRRDGGRAGTLLLATRAQAASLGPQAHEQLVVAPTGWVWALGRVLTTGGADLAAARALQDGLRSRGGPARRRRRRHRGPPTSRRCRIRSRRS